MSPSSLSSELFKSFALLIDNAGAFCLCSGLECLDRQNKLGLLAGEPKTLRHKRHKL